MFAINTMAMHTQVMHTTAQQGVRPMSNENLTPKRTPRNQRTAKATLALLLACVAAAGVAAYPPGPTSPIAAFPPGPYAPAAYYPPGPYAPVAYYPPGPSTTATA